MKFAIGDDVGQVKIITTTRGIDTSVQTSARAKIVSFLEPNRNAAIQSMQVLRFRGRDGIIAAASKGGLIRFLDPTVSPLAPEDEQILHTHQLPGGTDTDIIGLGHTASGILYAATSTGHIEFLTQFADESSTIAVSTHDFPGDFSAVGVHGEQQSGVPKAVALGGKDRDVEIWESSVSDGKATWKSVWKAKNVKPTKLGLEVPVWVSNIIFLPCSPPPPAPAVVPGKGRRHAPAPATTEAYRLAVSTHHSHLRLYDTTVSRRPVFTETLSRTPILTLHLHPSTPADADSPLTSAKESPETTTTLQELHFVYSDKNGHFGLHSTATRRSLGIYKGSTGAVLATAAEGGLVAGVGFDRYLWVYDGEERDVVSKVYVKTKGTAVVVLDGEDEVVVVEKKKDEEAEVWDELEEVGDEDLGRKKGKGAEEKEDDYTEALVTIKRKKMSKPPGGDKKRRIA
ncbi:uncharacterized protein H6S33_004071 [Morchella sextelata]|uniref:uncharacterized protein n=1 Tax=Morchella sextelata TaxID=1174677 RepID=UPI001D0490E3|nr:uncharacterized protein H6S33_004071 [Morchella sextelata]KAH0606410.1 hypothetical protein H6S33_004071 [Morchella sextelata]